MNLSVACHIVYNTSLKFNKVANFLQPKTIIKSNMKLIPGTSLYRDIQKLIQKYGKNEDIIIHTFTTIRIDELKPGQVIKPK